MRNSTVWAARARTEPTGVMDGTAKTTAAGKQSTASCSTMDSAAPHRSDTEPAASLLSRLSAATANTFRPMSRHGAGQL